MKDYQEQGKSLIVLDLPLLFEVDYENLCDDIIVVAVSGRRKLLAWKNGMDIQAQVKC